MINKIKSAITFTPNLTWQGFVLYSPISILGFPVSLLIVNPAASLLTLFLFGVLITLITFGLYLLAILISKNLNSESKIQITLFFLIPLLIGVFRGFIFYYTVNELELVQPSNLSHRVVSSMITTIFWLTLSNYLVLTFQKFLFQYQFALNQYLSQVQKTNTPQLSDKNSNLLNQMRLDLSASVDKFLGKSDPESFKKISAILVQQINQQIRPISRRIWIRNLNEFPVIRIRQLLKDAISNLEYSWRQLILLISALALIGNISIRSWTESFWRTLSFLIVLITLRFLNDRLKTYAKTAQGKITFLAFYGLIPVIISEFFVDAIGFQGSWIATILIAPVLPVLMIVLSLLRLANQDRSMILKILESSNDKTNLQSSSEEKIESASLASYLHNSLQSELLALSKQLEEAAENPDLEKSTELLQKVASTVNRSMADDFIKFNESPADRLQGVVKAWQGILDIQINFPLDLLHDNPKALFIVQTIEEVASNVSRYDNASKLNVSGKGTNLGFEMELQSNGTGKLIKKKGFGTEWFNQVALSPWTLEKNEIGSLYRIEL